MSSSQERAIFVGGPWHGHVETVTAGSMYWHVMEPAEIKVPYFKDWKFHWERRRGWRGWIDWLLGRKPVRMWDDDTSPSALLPPVHTYYRRRYRIFGETRLAFVADKDDPVEQTANLKLWQAISIGGHGQQLYG